MVIAILSMLFFFFYKITDQKNSLDFIRRTAHLIRTGELNTENKQEGITIIKDIAFAKKILQQGDLLFERRLPSRGNYIKLFRFEGDKYLLFELTDKTLLIKEDKNFGAKEFLMIVWFLLSISLLFIYISIIRSIYPLGILSKQIEKFKNGSMDIELDTHRKDEVGYLAREFNEAIKNIKRVTEARKWFLRNVAHELKTPLTKGKIATELLDDQRKKEIFSKIFNRLDLLINELLAIEKIATKEMRLSIGEHSLAQIIERAKELLFLDSSKLCITMDRDYRIKADFELFSIAVKNLLDNAVKFGQDKMAVEIKDGMMSFINSGPRPLIPQELFFEPFFKESSLVNRDGLGLGLYITKYILEKHGTGIIYKYEDDKNIFLIDIKPIIFVP
jgi:two-component system OmpR family sensor kinase